jgi:hypothetical protein
MYSREREREREREMVGWSVGWLVGWFEIQTDDWLFFVLCPSSSLIIAARYYEHDG